MQHNEINLLANCFKYNEYKLVLTAVHRNKIGHYRLTAGVNSGDDALPAATQNSLRCSQSYGPHKISTFDFANNAINNAILGIGVI